MKRRQPKSAQKNDDEPIDSENDSLQSSTVNEESNQPSEEEVAVIKYYS